MSVLSAQAAVERFFAAFYSGVDTARRSITDDFTLFGPFATAHNADEFIELARGLMGIVRGHHVVHWVVQGDSVAALYEIALQGPSDVRPLATGGWFTVVGEQLSGGRLIYDRMAFDAIVSPA
jgi:hypothetical protein